MEYWLVLTWLLGFALLTLLGAPLAAFVFRDLPYRGAAFALPTVLVPFAVLVFWIGQVTFGWHTIILSILVIAALTAITIHMGYTPDWRAVGGAYAIFTIGFLVLVLFRAANPGITPAGGEQFLHFGIVNAILRSNSLPPMDFWYAGEPIRYYYGTQLQVAAFTLLTDTPPRYGFNLGIAVFYGLLVVIAYGLAGSILALAGRSYHLGGILGAFFVAVGSALTTAVRLAFGMLPRETALAYGQPVFGAVRHMPYEDAVARLSSPAEWGWFYTRYVVEGTLQEFPFYSFVKADLHGHALSNGYILFAAALALAYYHTPPEDRVRRLGLVLGGIGLVAGVFGFMNTWSLPTAIGLAWLAVALAPAHPETLLPRSFGTNRGRRSPATDTRDRVVTEGSRVILATAFALGVLIVGILIAAPFLVFGQVPTNEGIGIFPPRTPLVPFLVIYGGLLLLFAVFLAHSSWSRFRDGASTLALLGIGLGSIAILLGLAVFPVLGLTVPLILGAWVLVRTDRIGFEGVLLIAGVGLLLAMDLVYANVWPPTQIRWNTTLKVAVQAWTLAAAAAGAISALLLLNARDTLGTTIRKSRISTRTRARNRSRHLSMVVTIITILVVVAVIAASTPFAVLTTSKLVAPDLADPDQLSLDGLATHDTWRAEEMAAIYWLDNHTNTPVIVEAPGHDTYRWTNPASTFTGLPTVIGWDHQRGYRGNEAFEQRADRVDAIYAGSWNESRTYLRMYNVSYVYVGPNERDAYGDNLRGFDREAFTVAFENDAVTIYAVDRGALGPPT